MSYPCGTSRLEGGLCASNLEESGLQCAARKWSESEAAETSGRLSPRIRILPNLKITQGMDRNAIESPTAAERHRQPACRKRIRNIYECVPDMTMSAGKVPRP